MTLQNSLRELAVLLELVEKVKKVILDYSWIPLNYRHNLIRNLEPIFSAWLPAHDAKVSREALAAWMIEHSYATGHGDTFENMLKELVGQAEARRVERWTFGKMLAKRPNTIWITTEHTHRHMVSLESARRVLQVLAMNTPIV